MWLVRAGLQGGSLAQLCGRGGVLTGEVRMAAAAALGRARSRMATLGAMNESNGTDVPVRSMSGPDMGPRGTRRFGTGRTTRTDVVIDEDMSGDGTHVTARLGGEACRAPERACVERVR